MVEAKRVLWEARGYKVADDVSDWLGLDEVDRKIVTLRVKLSREIRRRREAAELTQAGLAEKAGSSQSRVAKSETNRPGVSLDLLLRTYFATGASLEDLSDLLMAQPTA